MKKYIVTTKSVVIETWEVEAESLNQAKQDPMAGEQIGGGVMSWRVTACKVVKSEAVTE